MVVNTILHEEGKIIEWKWSSNSSLMKRPFWTSAYLVDQTLFDCGAPGSIKEIEEFIEKLPKEKIPLRCILTHAHEDHAGTGYFLREKYKLPIYAPAESIDLLKKGWKYKQYRRLAWGEDGMIGFEANPYPEEIITPKGYHFEIISLPGHTQDMHGFLERDQQWAFIADLMQPKYQMLFGKTFPQHEDIKIITKSLKKLYSITEGLDNLNLFVAGKGVFKGREIIKSRIEEIEDLHQKAHKLNDEFASIPDERKRMRRILRKLFGGESMMEKLTEGELSRENLVISLLKWELN